MKFHTEAVTFCFLLAALLSACGVDRARTHHGQLLDDKVTNQRVYAALTNAGTDFKDVQVQTTNGVVVLNGTVESPEIRGQAERIVRSVPRVNVLKDNLQTRQ